MKLPSGKNVYSSTPIYEGSHFTWGEATKNCTRLIRDLVIDGKLIITAINIEKKIVQTAAKMDKIRKILGNKAIFINSWYRPSNVNRSVGGTKWSRHQYGDGVDFRTNHLTPVAIANLIEPNHTQGGYHTYKDFTHIDWRGVKARW